MPHYSVFQGHLMNLLKSVKHIEKMLRHLEAQGKTVNHQRMLIQLVLSKFPSEVIVKLEESKQPSEM